MPLSWLDILNKPIFEGEDATLDYSREEAESELFAWQNVQFNFDETPGTAAPEWDDEKIRVSSPTSSISSAASSTSSFVPPSGWAIPGRPLRADPEPSFEQTLAPVSQQTAVAKQDTPAAKFHAYPLTLQHATATPANVQSPWQDEPSHDQRYAASRDKRGYAAIYRSQPIRAPFLPSAPAPAPTVKSAVPQEDAKPSMDLPQSERLVFLAKLEAQEAEAKTKVAVGPVGGGDVDEEERRRAILEDRKRRNTEASARFRAKKKAQEEATEKLVDDLQERAIHLESEIKDLKRENEWLKSLIVVKQPRRVASKGPFAGLADDEEPERGRRRYRN